MENVFSSEDVYSMGDDWSKTMSRSESLLALMNFIEQTIEEGTEISNKISCTPSSTTIDVDVIYIDSDEEYNLDIPTTNLDLASDEEYNLDIPITNFDLAFDEVAKSQEPLLNSMDPDNRLHLPLLNSMDPDNGSHPPLLNSTDPDNGSHPPLFNSMDLDYRSQASHSPLPALKECGNDPSKLKNKYVKVAAGVPFLQKKPIRSTSGSSDDEEAEGETNMKGNMDSSDAKRAKRTLANRESARRSRAKKQARITNLETEVSQLRDANSSLSQRLADETEKFNNKIRALEAELKASRTIVELFQENAKIGIHPGLNPMFNAMTGMPYVPAMTGMPYVSVQNHPYNHFYQPTSTNLMHGHDTRGIRGNVSSTQSVTHTTLETDLQ